MLFVVMDQENLEKWLVCLRSRKFRNGLVYVGTPMRALNKGVQDPVEGEEYLSRLQTFASNLRADYDGIDKSILNIVVEDLNAKKDLFPFFYVGECLSGLEARLPELNDAARTNNYHLPFTHPTMQAVGEIFYRMSDESYGNLDDGIINIIVRVSSMPELPPRLSALPLYVDDNLLGVMGRGRNSVLSRAKYKVQQQKE